MRRAGVLIASCTLPFVAFVAYGAMQGADTDVICPAPVTANPSDRPRLEGDSYVFRDGTRVRAETPDGRRATVDGTGRILFDDGTIITHDSIAHRTSMADATGSVLTTMWDGRARRTGRWAWRSSGEDADWIRYPDGRFVSDREPGCVPGEPDQSDGSDDDADDPPSPSRGRSVPAPSGGRCSAGRGLDMPVTPSDIPRRVGDNIIYRDGTRVRALDPDGRPGRINADGSVTYSDGTRIAHNSGTGDTTITRPDGRTSRTNVRAPDLRDGEYVWNDGMRTSATDPRGGSGKVNSDGSISYPDGTRISHDPRSGLTQTVHSDGRISNSRWSGARRDDSGSWRWNDGASAPGTDPGGGMGSATDDGWIRYPDGTLISHDAGTGETKYVRSDRSVRISNPCEEEEHVIADSCLGMPAIVDKCMVGTWKLTEGGPMEWLKAQGVPAVTRDNMGAIVMTINDDGTFRSQGFNMDYQLEFRGADEIRKADTHGQVKGTSGLWSAKNGKLHACFTQGGEAEGSTTVSTKKGPRNSPFALGGVAGQDGSSSYSCSNTTFITSSPMPRGGDMRHKFTRISAAPPRSR
jgi:hypothetical protein